MSPDKVVVHEVVRLSSPSESEGAWWDPDVHGFRSVPHLFLRAFCFIRGRTWRDGRSIGVPIGATLAQSAPAAVGEIILRSDAAAAQLYRVAAKRARAEAAVSYDRRLLRMAQEYEWRASCIEGARAVVALTSVPHDSETSKN